jgi:hypothetical protein
VIGHDGCEIGDGNVADAIFSPSGNDEGMKEPALPPQGVATPVLSARGAV